MASKNTNPFVLPGLGQSGEQAQNPVLAGMEMMRQAWQGLVNAGGLEQTAMMTPLTVEELDRRITDLRTVENWLRLNLSMLTSSIQGLEVQRATITTLRSFVETTMGVGHSGA
ncbi:MAG: transcriptional regulator, partial [Candidimonas sp.]